MEDSRSEVEEGKVGPWKERLLSQSGASGRGRSVDRRNEQDGQHQLLPGLPDEITLDQITPKLPWTNLFILSSISRVWRHAVHTRKIPRVQNFTSFSLVAKLDKTGKQNN